MDKTGSIAPILQFSQNQVSFSRIQPELDSNYLRVAPVVRPDSISENSTAVIAMDDAEGIDHAAGSAQLRVDCCEGLRPVHAVDVDLLVTDMPLKDAGSHPASL